ncbi:MAG: hypothetical protein AAFY48_15185 [Bacteroidota bacterium]
MRNALLLAMLVFFFACNNDDEQTPLGPISDCQFVATPSNNDGRLSDEERDIIDDCRENSFTTNNEIAANLIGEWELVGFRDGWRGTVTQPCAYIVFENNTLAFEFHGEDGDFLSVHSWEIENQWLKVDPPSEYLYMSLFCEQFMHGQQTDFGVLSTDVDEYIYEKVR